MTKTKNNSLNKRKITLIVRLFVILAFAIAIITVIYIRTNPKWKPAKLTIESADRFFDIR